MLGRQRFSRGREVALWKENEGLELGFRAILGGGLQGGGLRRGEFRDGRVGRGLVFADTA